MKTGGGGAAGALPEAEARCSLRRVRGGGRPCAECGQAADAGVVGFRGDEVLCALCMIDESPTLGLVLVLIEGARMYDDLSRTVPEARESHESFLELARLFGRVLAREGLEAPTLEPLLEGLRSRGYLPEEEEEGELPG